MKRRSLTFFLLLVFLIWNVLTYLFIAHKPQGSKQVTNEGPDLEAQLVLLEQDIKNQLRSNERLLLELQRYRVAIHGENGADPREPPAPHNASVARPAATAPSYNLSAAGQGRPAKPAQTQHIRTNFMYRINKLGDLDYPELDGANHPQPDDVAEEDDTAGGGDPSTHPLAVLVIACNRPSVNRNLDQIIKYRSSAERFPIVVSQDCGHEPTADVIRSYGDKVTHIQQPDLNDISLPKKDQKFKGYYKIARHYRWALNQVFNVLNYKTVIIVEDDLDLSPDFFEYMSATYPILLADPSLWCVSAWNDNGKEGMVSDDSELLYRTDFFPGLGWMLRKKTWLELEPKWPETFWDDWMRHPNQRRERACIRPEISRTKTFGKIGVSRGQFFDKYLKFIKLNERFVPFTKSDLSYLKKKKVPTATLR